MKNNSRCCYCDHPIYCPHCGDILSQISSKLKQYIKRFSSVIDIKYPPKNVKLKLVRPDRYSLLASGKFTLHYPTGRIVKALKGTHGISCFEKEQASYMDMVKEKNVFPGFNSVMHFLYRISKSDSYIGTEFDRIKEGNYRLILIETYGKKKYPADECPLSEMRDRYALTRYYNALHVSGCGYVDADVIVTSGTCWYKSVKVLT